MYIKQVVRDVLHDEIGAKTRSDIHRIEISISRIDQIVATHTKQLCVGFAEWQKQEERAEHIDWWDTEDKWVVNSHAPYFVDSKEVDANWITHSDLYEHYLKYLNQKEGK